MEEGLDFLIQETFRLIFLLSTKEAAGPGLEPGTARSKVWCATIAPAGNDSKSTESWEEFEETFLAQSQVKRGERFAFVRIGFRALRPNWMA